MSSIQVKTAFSSIRRSPFQAAAAIFVLTITFFIVTMLATLVYSSDRVLKYFETRPQVIAFLEDDISAKDVSALQVKLGNDERIKDVVYVSKDEALVIYKEATVDNPLLSELVSPSSFPASLEFSLADLSYAEDIIDEIGNEEIVNEVGFTANIGGRAELKDAVSRLRMITKYFRIGGVVFVGVLMFTSFLVLLIIIGMRLTSRRQEVEILDLIGATGAFIRAPIVLEAIIYALVGVFLGWLLALILVLYSTPSVIVYFGNISVLPRDTLELLTFFGILLGAQIIIGILLAVSGSSLAVARASKNK